MWAQLKIPERSLFPLINDVNPSLLRTSFFAPGRKYNAARDATGLSIAKQTISLCSGELDTPRIILNIVTCGQVVS